MRRGPLWLAVVALAAAPAIAGETARQILDRRRALDDTERHWNDRTQDLGFRLLDKRGNERTRAVRVQEKKVGDGERKTILFFLSPPEVKGTGFLAFMHRGRAADQWLYLPELQRVRQITGRSRGESFVGTDLSYRDLDVIQEMVTWTEDDAASNLREGEAVDGVACHVIDLAPKREDIGYVKIVLWLGRDDLVPRRLEFYEDGAVPKKRLHQADIRNVGRIPVANTMRVETLAAGTSTEVVVSNTRFDLQLSDDAFSQRALEHGPQ